MRTPAFVALVLSVLTCGEVLAQSGPDVVFFGSDNAADGGPTETHGLTYYGELAPGCALHPGEGYAPSMCWWPRTMWRFSPVTQCGHLWNRYTSHPGRSTFENPDEGSAWLNWRYGAEALTGLGMNINLEVGAAPPTLAPRSFDPRESGSALVPPSVAIDGRPVARWTRPMLGEAVDLVTGIPMVQEIDFELPFGSAVYRHVRSYSEMPPGRFEQRCYDAALNGDQSDIEAETLGSVAGDFLDWHGQGWMIGEAPLFLIDAHYQHVVYKDSTSPRRCYLVLNAHQSIPFDQDPTDEHGRYVAPPHFDAFLEHDGQWNSSDEVWETPPSVYRVWLHGRSICYTIRPVYRDVFPGIDTDGESVPPWEVYEPEHCTTNTPWPASDHDSPVISQTGANCGANGVPYWGVVERIDDRYGNCIDLQYCSVAAYELPEANRSVNYDIDGDGDTEETICHACCQSCYESGQIAYVRLIAGSDFDPDGTSGFFDSMSGSVEWTLLFTHRNFPFYFFPIAESPAFESLYPYHPQTAIHSIHVYEGDGGLSGDDLACRTLEFTHFVSEAGEGPPMAGEDTTPLDPLDRVEPSSSGSDRERAIPSGWVREIKYLYTEPQARLNPADETDHAWYDEAYAFASPVPGSGARLIKVTSTITDEDPEQDPSVEYTLYRYDSLGATTASTDRDAMPRRLYQDQTTLREIYRHDKVQDVLRRLNEAEQNPVSWTVNAFAVGALAGSSLFPDPAHALDGDAANLFDFSIGECVEQAQVQEPLRDFASLFLLRWDRERQFDTRWGIGTSKEFELTECEFSSEMVAGYLLSSSQQGFGAVPGLERLALKQVVPGVHLVRGIDGAGDQSTYRIYRFRYRPGFSPQQGSWDEYNFVPWTKYESGTGSGMYLEPFRSIYHEPFRDGPECQHQGYGCDAVNELSRDAVTWITVVDQYPSFEAAQIQGISEGGASSVGWDNNTVIAMPSVRRVIAMNAAGYILNEDVWEFSDDGTSFARTGAREEFIFDDQGRVIEHRTRAWGTEENVASRVTDGLINVFEYPPPDAENNPRYEVIRRGIKFGTGDENNEREVYPIEARTFHATRPELPLTVTYYPVPEVGEPTESYTTEYDYEFFNDGDQDPEDELIARKTVLGPAMDVGFGSSQAAYRPQETHVYSTAEGERGRLAWRVYGLEPVSGNDADPYTTRFYDYQHYDGKGRLIRGIVDAEADAPLGNLVDMYLGTDSNGNPLKREQNLGDLTVPTYPDLGAKVGSGRKGPGEHGLHATTKYLHNRHGVAVKETPYGPQLRTEDIEADSIGRQERTYRNREEHESGILEVFRTLTFTEYETPEKQGQVTAKSRDGRVDWTASVTWAWPPPQHGHLPQLEYTKVVDVDLEFDAAGRPTEVEAKGWDGKEIAVKGRTDQYGGFVREIAVDGTITRTYRDPQGRPERVFVGSQDKDLFWGYLGDNTDDLILTQRTAYGHGRTNYGLPKFTRHFRDRPSGQYTQWNWPGEGWGRLYGYDNRLREVWVRDVEPGMAEVLDANDHLIDGPSHRTRVTLYDHLDRVRFSIEYGTAAPDAPDGSGNLTIGGQTVNGHTVLPTAAQILGDASAPPLSLSETRYNDAGLVTEQLQYDVSDTTAGSHLSTITHYDGKGRPVLQMSPNAADVVNTYDAKGRIAERMVVRDAQETPFWELERTETEYDAADNAIKVITRQRLHDAVTSAALDDTNSVVTYQWNWFDNQGRLTASADLGSGQPVTDTFTNDTAPEGYDYTDGPSIDEQTLAVSRGSAPDWAIVTCYLYNPVGKKWVQATQTAYDSSTSSHDYRVELFQYDSLGNLTFWSENHAAHNDSPDKRMTAYDYEEGKLVRIAAVLPGHSLTYLTVSGPDGQSAGVGYYRPDWLADDGTLQITAVDYQGLDQYVDPLSGEVIWLGARVWTGETDGADNPVWSHNPSWPAAVHFPDKLTGRPDTSGPPDLTFTYYSDGLVRSRKDRLGREFIHHYDRDSQRIRTEILYPDGLYAGNDPEDLANLLLYTYDKRGNLTVASSGEDADGDGTLDGPDDAIITQHQYLYNPQGQLLTEYQSYGGPVDTGTTPRIDYAWDYASADQGNHNRLAQMTYPTRVQSGTRRVIDLIYDGHNGIDDAISRITRIEDDTSTTAAAVEYQYTGASRRVGREWQSGSPGALTPFMTQSAETNPDLAGYAGLDRHGRVTDLHYRLTDGSQSTVHRYEYGYNSDGSRLFARTTQQGQPNTRSQLHAYDILGRLRETHRGTLSSTNDTIEFSQAVQATQVAWGLERLGNWTESTDSLHAGRVEHRDDDGVPGFETLVLAEEHDTDLRNELTGIDRDEGSGPVAVAHIHDAAGNLVADGQYYIQYDAFNRVSTVYELNDLTFDAEGIPISGTPGAWRASYAYDALGRRIHKEVPWAYDSDARWTSYYYDGVRRIAEVHRDPLAQAGIGGNPNPQGSHTTYTDREYVWGPDYVDECLWQIDRPGNTAFVLQDANFNVVGLTDPQGALLQQYDYDPYGTPTAIDTLGTFGHNRLGHQGLFADRYDSHAPAPDLAVDADVMYYARNRDYRPDLGRWVQRDPRNTALPLLGFQVAGSPIDARVAGANVGVQYSDSANLYQAYGHAPMVRSDPTGLFFGMGIMGFMTTTTVESELRGTDAGVKMGAVDAVRGRLAQLMGKYYGQLYGLGDDILMEFSGYGLGAGGGAAALIKTVEALGGRNTGELLAMGATTFRENLGTLTRFSGRIGDTVLDAHHIIPQEFREQFAKLGVNIDNPIFGQWVDRGTHLGMHADGYNQMWADFVGELARKGVFGDEAMDEVARFVVRMADEYGMYTPIPR